jgi:hypothetical protein
MEKEKIKPRNYWKEEDENLLKQWSDKAQCYQWLHNKGREIYQKKNTWFSIPVIIISTLTGTANFAQDRFSEEAKPFVVVTIGTLSIIAGIISTIYQFLKISEINEGHRIATLSWGKFHRNLETELTRHPLDRMKPNELLNLSKEEFNRLIEISPPIDKKILQLFNTKFSDNLELYKPAIGNTINSVNIYRMTEEERKLMINEVNKNVNLKKNLALKKEKKELTQIEKFKQNFYNLHNRMPTDDEISKNMKFIKNDDDMESSSTGKSESNILEDDVIDTEISNENQDQNEFNMGASIV